MVQLKHRLRDGVASDDTSHLNAQAFGSRLGHDTKNPADDDGVCFPTKTYKIPKLGIS